MRVPKRVEEMVGTERALGRGTRKVMGEEGGGRNKVIRVKRTGEEGSKGIARSRKQMGDGIQSGSGELKQRSESRKS